jgi:hypothetical protein
MALTMKGVRSLIARGETGKFFDRDGLYLVVDSPTSARRCPPSPWPASSRQDICSRW